MSDRWSKFTFKPKTLLARSAITAPERPAPTENQRRVKHCFQLWSPLFIIMREKNTIEEEAKIWESENLWQGYISSPSHASLSIPPSQPEDNISFKATPTVFSQQIQNSLISSNDQMNRPDSSPDAGPPPHPPRRVASLPSGFPLFPPERLKLFQTEQKIIQCQNYTCGSLITIWFVIGQLIPTEFHLCISAS